MLKQEFLDRKQRRSSYSERAFARDLKVSPGYISLLFRGHRSLSPAKGVQIAQRLGWSEEKTNHFVSLIQKHALDMANGGSLQQNYGSKAFKFSEMELDKFRYIADLNHLSALTLIQSRDGLDIKRIASILGLSAVEAELVMGRLVRLGLVRTEAGKFKGTKRSLEIKEVSSEAIRSFHRQCLQKAEESIEEQTVQERNLSALTMCFDASKMAEAKLFINRFLKSFEKKFGHAADGEIYQVNTQLFRLSTGKNEIHIYFAVFTSHSSVGFCRCTRWKWRRLSLLPQNK